MDPICGNSWDYCASAHKRVLKSAGTQYLGVQLAVRHREEIQVVMRVGVFVPLLSQLPLTAVLKQLAALHINSARSAALLGTIESPLGFQESRRILGGQQLLALHTCRNTVL